MSEDWRSVEGREMVIKRIEALEKNIKIVNKDHQKVVIDIDSLEKMSKKAGEERLDNYELLIAQAKQIAELKEEK